MKKVKLRILTAAERTDLERDERDIRDGREATIKSAVALLDIYNRKLYKARCGAWDRYCQEHLGYSRQYAYELLAGARTLEKLSTQVDSSVLPDTIGAAAALGKVPDDKKQLDLWEKLVEQAEGALPKTAEVEQAVKAAMRGLNPEEQRKVLAEEKRTLTVARDADKPEMRSRRLNRALRNLEKAQRALLRVEDVEEEQADLADLIARICERL